MPTRPSLRWLPVLIASLSLAAAAPAGDAPVRYDGHRIVRAWPDSSEQIDLLHALGVRLLSDAEGPGPVDYLVPPQALPGLDALGLPYTVLCADVQARIDAERAALEQAGPRDPRDPAWFTTYKTLAEIEAKLQTMAADRPDLVTYFSIGSTWLGRPIHGVRISGPGTGKPAVLFDGAQHSREWVAPMVTMWIADRLVYEYDTNPALQALVDRLEFFIIPVVNVDGYLYTFEINGDRLWRKNRRDNPGTTCDGVDLNRNWGTGWGGSGSSGDPCSETYRGSAAFSEPETAALRDFFIAHPQIVATIDFHSYSQLILSPFGYTSALPPDHPTFMELNRAMHDAILAVHGMPYAYGPIYSTIYPASGGSVDWCYAAEGIFAFTIELRDTGQYGFLLPPEQIIPTCQENFAAVLVLAEWSATPIKFSFPAGRPDPIPYGTEVPVVVEILSIGNPLDPATPRLAWRTDSAAPFTETPLTPLGGTRWQAALPATACGRTLQYYFAAADTAGTAGSAPEDAPAAWYTATALPIITVLEDDLEADSGWTAGAPGDTATTGQWNRMDPQGTAAQPEDDHTPAPGVACWVTDGRAGSSIGSYDVDGGRTTLLTPVFDASAPTIAVGYWRWYSNDQGSAPNDDVFLVDISGDGGATWVNAETVGPAGPETSGGWYYHELRVADFIAPSAAARLRFVAADLGAGSIVEAAVDDVRVSATGDCPGGPGDLNCDDVVDFADIDAFVIALADPAGYAATYPDCDRMRADCNADGAVDFADIDPFVTLLAGGG